MLLVVSPMRLKVAELIPPVKVDMTFMKYTDVATLFCKKRHYVYWWLSYPECRWFMVLLKKIFPLILKQLPEIKFHIIGSRAPAKKSRILRQTISSIMDLSKILNRLWMTFVLLWLQLRYGAGVKGKVNMSMVMANLSLVLKLLLKACTHKKGIDVLKAETPEEFSNQVVRLYQDENLTNSISEGGFKKMLENYFSFDAAKECNRKIMNR